MDTKLEGKTTGCLDCKHKSDLFKLLTDEELGLMDKNRFEVRFRAGETIRKQGTYLSHVLSINSGLCKLYIEGQNNQNIILRIIKPVNFIGGPGMYVDQRHHYSVAALTDASVCFIDMKVFKNIIHENNKFADEFIRDLSRNSLSTYSRLLNLTQKQMPGRIADALIYLADDIFRSRKFKMNISNHDLADLSGMTKDSAVRILSTFKKEGLINKVKDEIEILDYDALVRIKKTG